MIDVDNTIFKDYTFIDLFSGIGGFRLALESLGAKCVFSSEINPQAAKTYQENFGELPNGDITQINESDIPSHDILCAGFPCQAFSASGKKMGFADSRGTLFFDVARIAKAKQPKIILLENVMYFVAHDNGNTLSVVKNTLTELGYTFFFQILNAADYGIPQQRKRTYMVAFRNDLGIKEFNFPSRVPLFLSVNDIMIDDESVVSNLHINRDYYAPKRKPKVNNNEVILVGFFNKAGQGERVYNPKGVSITLSTSNKAIFTTTPDLRNPRRLHYRECARLMGFPDSYSFIYRPIVNYRLIGNSVVVDVIQYIALQIHRTISGEPEPLILVPF